MSIIIKNTTTTTTTTTQQQQTATKKHQQEKQPQVVLPFVATPRVHFLAWGIIDEIIFGYVGYCQNVTPVYKLQIKGRRKGFSLFWLSYVT